MTGDSQKYKAMRIEALKKERQHLLDKGVPLHAPRSMKLANMIKRLYRELGQGDLFDSRGKLARGGEVRSGGDSKATAGATVQTSKN